MLEDGLTEEQATKYAEDLGKAKQKIEDKVIKTAYFKTKFPEFGEVQREELVNNSTSKEGLLEYLKSKNIPANGVWEELEQDYDAIKETQNYNIIKALKSQLPDETFSDAQTPYITSFLEGKLGGDTAKNLLSQNPDNPDVEKLWGLSNKKAFISNSVASPAKKSKAAKLLAKAEKDFLVDAFFNKAGNLKSPKEYNFDYYGNDPAAKEIFREKLAALSNTINEAYPGDAAQAVKISNFIHDAILRNRKDLSCFIEGKELAALNRLINLSPEEFKQFHEIVISPTHHDPKCVMSFSEVESSYSSYTSFVKGPDITQSQKDKLLQFMPPSNKDVPSCNIGFEEPRIALPRMQYIISTASDQTEHIDKINSVKLDSYNSAFYMKRYADLPIVDQECIVN